MNIGDVDLRIVHSTDVIGHEQADHSRVERLAQRLQSDGMLKNPPVVTEVGDRYVLLDGATRVGALRKLGIADLLVQVVGYYASNVRLRTWSHVVIGMSRRGLLDRIEELEGVKVEATELDAARGALAGRTSLCYLVCENGGVFVAGGAGQLEMQISVLNDIVDLYQGQAEVYRVTGDEIGHLLTEYPDLTAVVVFPRYRRREIIRAALNGAQLPAGVTRHVVSGRALGLNVDLAMLDADIPVEQKNRWLDNLIGRKMKQKRVRFYPEPVFTFDE